MSIYHIFDRNVSQFKTVNLLTEIEEKLETLNISNNKGRFRCRILYADSRRNGLLQTCIEATSVNGTGKIKIKKCVRVTFLAKVTYVFFLLVFLCRPIPIQEDLSRVQCS